MRSGVLTMAHIFCSQTAAGENGDDRRLSVQWEHSLVLGASGVLGRCRAELALNSVTSRLALLRPWKCRMNMVLACCPVSGRVAWPQG